VKLTDDFDKFLCDEVNLDTSRITKLETNVESIKKFLNESDWGPGISRYSAQGSWAHKTIIKPPGDRGFDADLLVFIAPVADWTPEDYIFQLRWVFRASGIYREKTTLSSRCVTIEYAGDFDVDVVPCVIDRGGGASSRHEVCNRVEDEFEPTDSEAYTAWLEQRNGWTGPDKLREVVRLLKYLRDIKLTFACKSILLTTLVGERVTADDVFYQNIYFPDLPTALKTLIGRLDNYLQDHPELHDVCNPVLTSESFIRHWDADKYKNFCEVIRRYREWVDEAFDEPDETTSRSKWQRVFGDEFGKSGKRAVAKIEEAAVLPARISDPNVQDAVHAVRTFGDRILAHVPQIVPWMKPAPWRTTTNNPVAIKATTHYDRSGNRPIGPIRSGELLKKGIEIRFEAMTATGMPYSAKDQVVQWQVVNSDRDAWNADGLRGGFYRSQPRGVRWETTKYRGVHWVQAFVIRKRDRACIGRSDRFFVVIE
jgi:hypothetical protein